ncbi:Pls/PosA family non-ribosomal peptide synthetase [Rhizobium rhizogenes]|uniref:Pls/PosA family non-ribosomal peptide synthetase n=1 Tax=Rhizobium rhizogenes TaxID=359 RepID=UPI00080FB095|nr:Pls/PosA family non-ribosomal peptide synthetase [Rhizobium rhizogenes]MDJ1633921.1 amino acid adenylation domain-containing protein [Rhizobium rhizogenes]NTG77374.1 amino acid adenylation domain-containing protein [Rhizobium rhizogenes]NTI45424.1 amino acid adenylation domain-containing protein [Rhizobium rhizogenes]OCJ15799.1 peptide synthetase [Agrobacterium sp. B131/95]
MTIQMSSITSNASLSVFSGNIRPEFIRNETLVDIFKATVARAPDKTALTLIGTDQTLTYAELDRLSDRVARALSLRGIGPGDFVGLWFQRSLELHVALLAILKAGAGYIPFDAAAPADRVATSLADCGAKWLLTHDGLAEFAPAFDGETLLLETLLGDDNTDIVPRAAIHDDPAYAIYTSGSTGKPKGIVISHRNICHYLRAGNDILGVNGSDIVLQQASVAFDLSLEEIFVPYLVGATLKVATAAVMAELDRLADVLEAEKITVIDTVPTLLTMLERDVESLRVIIVGGEACPPAIVSRFSRPGRRLINTYGPTETTVVATYAELAPSRPITIGGPIANMTAYVVDENLALVTRGDAGELLIGGPGVAAGYRNLPQLTASKFVANPFAPHGDPVLYRSGDAVLMDEEGQLHFLGRIDDQVKIRGYRIELGEIETVIGELAEVKTASVVVHRTPDGEDMLVAHVVASGNAFDREKARAALATKLPPYMVPTAWQSHVSLPRLASGKIDRKTLAAIPLANDQTTQTQEPPRNWAEAQLLKAAIEVLRVRVVNLEADFFTELGGHSMLAARFVSEVRKIKPLAGIALRDVYAGRSLRGIAAILEAGTDHSSEPDRVDFTPVPWRRRFLCGLAQAIVLPFIIALATLQWIGLLLASILLIQDGVPMWNEMLVLGAIYVGLNLGEKLMVVGLKWLIIGRTRPGVYPLWGSYYFRIWLMQRIVQLTAPKFLKGSPLIRLYMRALGADVGRDVMIDEFEEGAIDLVRIGARSSLGVKLKLANVEVIGNQIHVGTIDIGEGVQIGNGCVIGHNVKIGDGAEIGDLTAIAAHTNVKAHTRWDGSPARQTSEVEPTSDPTHPELGAVARAFQFASYFVAYNLSLVIGLLPIFPAFFLFSAVQQMLSPGTDEPLSWWMVTTLAWPAALVLIVVSMAVVVVLRWVLLPRVVPGRYSIFGNLYFRKWVVGLTTEAMLETLNSLYATVFMRNWYRLMGAKIGKGTEISASFAGRYDLIEMGRDNFIGDETVFGDEEIRNGWMLLERLKTGDRCFFGNSSVISQGAVIEDDALVGIKTRLPDSLHVKAGETWCGSPAFQLPTRQKLQAAAASTYAPPLRMRLVRVAFEAMHTSLPTAILIVMAMATANLLANAIDDGAWGRLFWMLMATGLATSGILYLVAVAFKWTLIGTYKPMNKPMWSWWAMRTEAVAVFYGGLASKALLDYLRGTPFLPWLLRPFGTKIGRGTWINTTDICEFDCTEIGDHAVLNMGSCPQTHLYEDRIMKVGRIKIGAGVTIGSGSTVLHDASVGDFAEIGLLTFVMKGETIPAGTSWAGTPAQAVHATQDAVPANQSEALPSAAA